MRIGLVSPTFPPLGASGIGSATFHLARGLQGLGHEVNVFTWQDPTGHARDSFGGVDVERLPRVGFEEFVALGVRRAARVLSLILTLGTKRLTLGATSRTVLGSRAMRRLARSGHLDDLDMLAACEWGAACEALKFVPEGCRRVAMLHSSFYSISRRYGPEFKLSRTDVRIANSMELAAIEFADAVIAPSAELANDARDWLGVTQEITVVPNCVDLTYVDALRRSAPRRSPGERVDVVFVGRVDRWKGAGTLDAVVRELREDRRGRAWRFRIVGAGTNPNTFPALQIGSDRGVDVELMGELGFDDTIRAIATADSVIVPSRAESFGMVALEAGACAVPAVASRVGGLCDIIEDGVTGLLVSPDDVEGFVTGLVMAATESGAAWGRGARHRVERLYDSRLVASRFVEVAAGAK